MCPNWYKNIDRSLLKSEPSEPYICRASDDFRGLSQKRVNLIFDSLESTLPENIAIDEHIYIFMDTLDVRVIQKRMLLLFLS